jgi:hypothetical protein
MKDENKTESLERVIDKVHNKRNEKLLVRLVCNIRRKKDPEKFTDQALETLKRQKRPCKNRKRIPNSDFLSQNKTYHAFGRLLDSQSKKILEIQKFSSHQSKHETCQYHVRQQSIPLVENLNFFEKFNIFNTF